MKLPKKKSLIAENRDIEIKQVDLSDVESFSYYFSSFEDEKELHNYIKKIESLIRNSFEYRKYISYLKEEENLISCSFFKNLNIKDFKKLDLEFHHYPFTLYDITKILVKYITKNFTQKNFSSFEIADAVMQLHYKNQVGLIPLIKTLHELAHNGELFINLNLVYGNITQFFSTYEKYIDSDLLSSYNLIEELSSKDDSNKHNEFLLKKKFTEVIMDERKIEQIIIQQQLAG